MGDIITKIKRAGLVGRGGASYPTWRKWTAVAEAITASVNLTGGAKETGESKCFVVCNAAEGEPGVRKDGYILENWPERVVDGLKIAMDFFSSPAKREKIKASAIIYIKDEYYKKYQARLIKAIGQSPIELFIKPLRSGYIGGEESAVLNAIENKRIEPRLRPPYPTAKGLWGYPTLINNVETFYNISLVNRGEYKNHRFYTINNCLHNGVYELPENYTIAHVLKESENTPAFPFFVQCGGDVSGEMLSSSQLNRQAAGAGSITIYALEKAVFKKIIRNWLEYYSYESCGQCTPCREGIYRLREIFAANKQDWTLIRELTDNLSSASFCGLGSALVTPIASLINNILPLLPETKHNPGRSEREAIYQKFNFKL